MLLSQTGVEEQIGHLLLASGSGVTGVFLGALTFRLLLHRFRLIVRQELARMLDSDQFRRMLWECKFQARRPLEGQPGYWKAHWDLPKPPDREPPEAPPPRTE